MKSTGTQASEKDLEEDALRFSVAFAEDARKLQIFNHMHSCAETCLKNQKKHTSSSKAGQLNKKRAPPCRFWFFHIVELVLHSESRNRIKRIRRRGKKLVPEPAIASTDDHNEFGRFVPRRSHPFIGSTSDVGQVGFRCNLDFQYLLRAPPPEHGEINGSEDTARPGDRTCMYGFRLNTSWRQSLWSAVTSIYRAAHNCDYYITKYASKMSQTLKPIMEQLAEGIKRLEASRHWGPFQFYSVGFRSCGSLRFQQPFSSLPLPPFRARHPGPAATTAQPTSARNGSQCRCGGGDV